MWRVLGEVGRDVNLEINEGRKDVVVVTIVDVVVVETGVAITHANWVVLCCYSFLLCH